MLFSLYHTSYEFSFRHQVITHVFRIPKNNCVATPILLRQRMGRWSGFDNELFQVSALMSHPCLLCASLGWQGVHEAGTHLSDDLNGFMTWREKVEQ
jgi:hypothetical protein